MDVWPFSVLSPADLEWSPDGGVNSGGLSLSGVEQLDRTDGGPKWVARMIRIPLDTRNRILAFQALQMILGGGATPILLPRRPASRAPVPGGETLLVTHSDDTPFDDVTFYATPSGLGYATGVGAMSLRDDEATFTFTGAIPLIGGEDFSIEHPTAGWRMYRIMRILAHVGDEYTVQFGPNLREDVPDGQVIDFESPRCAMRLSNPKAFRSALAFNKYGWVDAEFEEAFY